MITDLELIVITRDAERHQQAFARDVKELQDQFRKDLDNRLALLVEQLLDLHDEMDVLDVGWSTNAAGVPTINFRISYPAVDLSEVASG